MPGFIVAYCAAMDKIHSIAYHAYLVTAGTGQWWPLYYLQVTWGGGLCTICRSHGVVASVVPGHMVWWPL